MHVDMSRSQQGRRRGVAIVLFRILRILVFEQQEIVDDFAGFGIDAQGILFVTLFRGGR